MPEPIFLSVPSISGNQYSNSRENFLHKLRMPALTLNGDAPTSLVSRWPPVRWLAFSGEKTWPVRSFTGVNISFTRFERSYQSMRVELC